MNMYFKRIYWLTGLAGALMVVVVLVVLMAGAFFRGQPATASAGGTGAETGDQEETAIPVHTIRPKYEASFAFTVEAPAEVVPYEFADLEAHVAGQVEYIRKAEGSSVKVGELLVKIAVPDLDDDVRQKDSVIHQRQAELKLAQANERIAAADVTVATKAIDVANAEVATADAMKDFRVREQSRFVGLVQDKAATPLLADEREFFARAAVADLKRAYAAVDKAKADLSKARAKLEAAGADIILKRELVDVAEKDRDRAQAMADYSKISSRFDGVITRRYVNRGSFVQNATTAHSQPLLHVERRDIVTVTMKVPDTFASYVNSDTEAEIDMSELPGQILHGRVTRFSPTLESRANDRTLLAEVDLFNGTDEEYQRFLAKEKANDYADLKEGELPLLPRVTSKGTVTARRPLLPGMYGVMKLILRKLPQAELLPSDAIYREGGKPYLWLVKNGKVHKVPIEVQVDDQKLAKVAIITKTPAGTVKRDLTGEEEVVYSNQSQLSDGEVIKPIPVDWSPED